MISVIIVVFNAADYLRFAIESVLSQTYKELEIIVVDDGSTDSTLDILNKYSNYPNFSIIKRNHTKNLGGNRNDAIKIAKGEFIAFIDGDDIWNNDKLEIELEYLRDYEMVCSNAILINEKNEVISDKYSYDFESDVDLKLPEMLSNNWVTVSSVLMKKTAIEKSGYFEDGSDTRAEDYVLWLKFLDNRINKIRYINKPLLKYRIHNNNWSNSNLTDWIKLLNRAISLRYNYVKDKEPGVRKSAKLGCRTLYIKLIKINYKNHDYKSARENLIKYLKLNDNIYSKSFIKYFLILIYVTFLYYFQKSRFYKQII